MFLFGLLCSCDRAVKPWRSFAARLRAHLLSCDQLVSLQEALMACQRCVCRHCGRNVGWLGLRGFGVSLRRHEGQCQVLLEQLREAERPCGNHLLQEVGLGGSMEQAVARVEQLQKQLEQLKVQTCAAPKRELDGAVAKSVKLGPEQTEAAELHAAKRACYEPPGGQAAFDEGVPEVCSRHSPKASAVSLMTPLAVLGELGAGAFGAVVSVKHVQSGETYALKTASLELALAEAKILQKCCCRHIVKLFHHDHDRGRLLLELCAGTAADLGELSEEPVLHIGASVACALSHLHSRRIIHRDVKPQNILLTTEGEVRLSDMGLAVEGDVASGMVGSWYYVAPEMFLGIDYTHAVDNWALGCSIYTMLSGSPPFIPTVQPNTHAEAKSGMMEKVANFAKHRNLVFPGCSQNAQQCVLQLLCVKPATRLRCHELSRHPFFAQIDFQELQAGKVKPPYTWQQLLARASELGPKGLQGLQQS
ncbi:unnamed protein product [Effrenium voratum]|nr:unnamed protein product [Effrenium voratum]